MKKYYLVISVVMLLMSSLAFMSCGSDDETEKEENYSALYGRWVLLGYVSNGNIVSHEKSGTGECYLNLDKDGNFNGKFCNWFQGKYSFSRNGEFSILDGITTQMCSTDSNLMFMEKQIINVRSFELEGSNLRLYYSTNDYLKFSR